MGEDDLGLVASIRQQAQSHGMFDYPAGAGTDERAENRPHFSMEEPDELPPLPAAVEVACYRIVQEAITNVVRHAQAGVCRVRIALDVIERAAGLRPDVILMDIQMPDVNGIEATRRILGANPGIGIVVLTMFGDDDSVFSAMRAGARGCVLKGAPPSEILKVLRAVAEGEAHFGPEIARRLMDFFSAPKPPSPEETFSELTSREREILDLIAQGHTNAKIARHLFVSLKTVRNHISHIFTKLQIVDRTQAILRAREAGLGQDAIS